jgi:hypothetical protein
MGRLAIVLFVFAVGCKKQDEQAAEPELTATPSRGYSVTKMKGSAEDGEDAHGDKDGDGGSGDGATRAAVAGTGASASGPLDAGAGAAPTADAALFGGNGTPAHRDDEGRIRGPGGPVFMGRGPECNAERDHCMREGVWFAVDNLVAGKLYRATPMFELEDKWYTWRGKEESFAMRFRTKVGTKQTLRAGDPVIWFIDENASKKFVDNEYDALTSSRWSAGVVEAVEGDNIRVKGWTYGMVPIDTTRVILETKRP